MYIRRPMCLFSLGFLLFLYLIMLLHPRGIARLKTDPLPDFHEEERLTLYGTVEKKEQKNQKAVIYLKDVSIIRTTTSAEKDIQKCRGFILYLSTENAVTDNLATDSLATDKETGIAGVRLGARIKASGKLRKFAPAENEGQFNARSYYMIRGYDGSLMQTTILKQSAGHDAMLETLYQLREHTKQIFYDYMSAEKAGILQALVLGDKTALDTEVKELYQNAGISHILSLSGLHIATVGLCLLKLLKKSGLPIPGAILISGVTITAYAIMTGLSTSTLRALFMFLLGVLALLAGRTYDLLSAAAFSAVLILIENPYYLYDAAFQLSFGAVIGIGLFCPVMEKLVGLHKVKEWIAFTREYRTGVEDIVGSGKHALLGVLQGMLQGMLQGISLSMATQLATLPIVMWNFYQFPCYGILLNLIVVPLMGLVLGLGIVAGFIGNLPVLSIFTASVLKIAEVILFIYEKLAEISTRLPGNLWITGKPELWQIGAYYVLLVLGLVWYSYSNSICREKTDNDRCSDIKNNNDSYKKKSINISSMILEGVVVLAVILLSVRSRTELELHALSVGQGDCSVLYGKETPVILIDGGSTDVSKVGKYRISPFLKANAISQIDYVFLSHMDSDHVNGVLELLTEENSGITIKRIVIPKAAAYIEPRDNYMELTALAKARDIPVYLMEAGDALTIGDNAGALQISCLSPSISGENTRDANDNSLVLHVKHLSTGFKMLFTGDISSAVESELQPMLTAVHFLKTAHHGSKTATSEAFLQKLSPQLATISAGKNNSYGHPHKEVLDRLEQYSVRWLRTDECGEIMIEIDGGKMRIRRFLVELKNTN